MISIMFSVEFQDLDLSLKPPKQYIHDQIWTLWIVKNPTALAKIAAEPGAAAVRVAFTGAPGEKKVTLGQGGFQYSASLW